MLLLTRDLRTCSFEPAVASCSLLGVTAKCSFVSVRAHVGYFGGSTVARQLPVPTHLDDWRPGVSKLGIYTALGVVGSGTKVVGVVYIPREVQHPGHSFTAAADAGWAERYSGNHSRFIYCSQSPERAGR